MKTTTSSGTVQRNNTGSHNSRPQPITGCKGMGRAATYPASLGARRPQSQQLRSDDASADPRRRPLGGQASSPGLFGVPTVTGRPRRFGQVAAFQAPPLSCLTPAMRLAAIHADERERLGTWRDDESDFARHCAGAGQVEFTLAMEGN